MRQCNRDSERRDSRDLVSNPTTTTAQKLNGSCHTRSSRRKSRPTPSRPSSVQPKPRTPLTYQASSPPREASHNCKLPFTFPSFCALPKEPDLVYTNYVCCPGKPFWLSIKPQSFSLSSSSLLG